MLLALAVLCLAAAAFLAGEAVTYPHRERRLSLRRAAEYGSVRLPGNAAERMRFRERVILPTRDSLARIALRLNPRSTVESVGIKLQAAGMGRKISPTAFLAAKAAFGGIGVLVGLLMGPATFGFLGGILFTAALGAGGFALPGILVNGRAKRRREEIRAQLPDALDLLAVSVEAGMGFDGAISKLTEYMEGPLGEEFALTLGEMRIGESRSDALKKLGDRANTPEVAAFTRAIIQADQLGISLGRILRVQAIDTRDKRQSAAEERAMKAPIKMLFPTVMFIFPAMFMVILGPALINLSKLF
jgi:tight adherence protein C